MCVSSRRSTIATRNDRVFSSGVFISDSAQVVAGLDLAADRDKVSTGGGEILREDEGGSGFRAGWFLAGCEFQCNMAGGLTAVGTRPTAERRDGRQTFEKALATHFPTIDQVRAANEIDA